MRHHLHFKNPREKQNITCWPAAIRWDLSNREKKKTPNNRVNIQSYSKPDSNKNSFSCVREPAHFGVRANTCMKRKKKKDRKRKSCSFRSPVHSPPAAHSGDIMDYLTMRTCPPGTWPTCRRWTPSQVALDGCGLSHLYPSCGILPRAVDINQTE